MDKQITVRLLIQRVLKRKVVAATMTIVFELVS